MSKPERSVGRTQELFERFLEGLDGDVKADHVFTPAPPMPPNVEILHRWFVGEFITFSDEKVMLMPPDDYKGRKVTGSSTYFERPHPEFRMQVTWYRDYLEVLGWVDGHARLGDQMPLCWRIDASVDDVRYFDEIREGLDQIITELDKLATEEDDDE